MYFYQLNCSLQYTSSRLICINNRKSGPDSLDQGLIGFSSWTLRLLAFSSLSLPPLRVIRIGSLPLLPPTILPRNSSSLLLVVSFRSAPLFMDGWMRDMWIEIGRARLAASINHPLPWILFALIFSPIFPLVLFSCLPFLSFC